MIHCDAVHCCRHREVVTIGAPAEEVQKPHNRSVIRVKMRRNLGSWHGLFGRQLHAPPPSTSLRLIFIVTSSSINKEIPQRSTNRRKQQ